MNRTSNSPELLIIDDEPNFRESLEMALEESFTIRCAGTLRQAREILATGSPDVVLLDVRLPDGNGIDLLPEIKALGSLPVVIVMTAYATVENAVNALKEGAVDYFIKPFDIEKLKRELGVFLENRILQKKIAALSLELRKVTPPFVTAGTGDMREIVERSTMVAPLDIPVFIMGETGTGKEKLARWLHELSGCKGELVTINCAALPKDLIESELFGYTRGAFSGAAAHKEGLIEKAEEGTLFLDEIGELPDTMQAKLLRVLEYGVYYKLGDTRERRARFRLISASNRDLADPASRFRPDLFFRINGITFALPPLRERRQDIPLLVSTFIKEANHAYNKAVKGVAPEMMEQLRNHPWPGNIRELKWCINRAVALAAKEILDRVEISLKEGTPLAAEHAPAELALPFADALARLEREYIANALAAAGGNKTKAAQTLGISVRALHYKLEKYGM